MDKGLRILILEDIGTDAELMEQELRRAGISFLAKCVEIERLTKKVRDALKKTGYGSKFLQKFDIQYQS